MRLGGAFCTEFEREWQIPRSAAADGIQVLQPCCQCPDGIVSRGPEHKAAEIIFLPLNLDIQSPIGFAAQFRAQHTILGAGTADAFKSVLCTPASDFAIAHTERTSGFAIKEAVLSPEIQVRVIEEQIDRNTPELSTILLG